MPDDEQRPDASAGGQTPRAGAAPRVPPRWFVRTAWVVHRAIYRLSGGRLGLSRPRPTRWGMMHLTTTGRRTGQRRAVIVAYMEDGPNLVTLAMNGWADAEPAWWLNLQAQPDATVTIKDGTRAVRARAAQGAERDRLWEAWKHLGDDLDGYSTLRTTPTTVVVLEPRPS
ncbi:nitroreductase/quinone reductase family protein [Cellulomonas massiliensis]|uniref:nitroreductase/quinone reductase family protein n=1 Tax=Cellulomonas massiliensis TaxID=1465811 RepID=UPI0003697426|nr:nitroreductase/quinone reductase family protein [Cellulomonas massiliensis]